MKNKLFSIFTALAMVLGILVSPFTSAHAAEGEKTTKITLHKILMTKEDLQAKKVTVGQGDDAVTKVVVKKKNAEGKDEYYDGNNTKLDETADKDFIDGYASSTEYVFPGTTGQNGTEYIGNSLQDQLEGYFGQSADEIPNVFFAVQNKDGQYLGKADGKPLADNLQDPKAEGFEDAVLGGKTTENGLELDTSKLEQKNTEYKIVEIVELSTYKSEDGKLLAAKKAVPVNITLPLTNEDGVVAEAHVYPKNTEEKPQIDKNFAKDNKLTEVKKDDKDLSTEVGEDKKPVVSPKAGADYDNYQKEKARVTAELGKEVPYEVKTKVNAGSRYQNLNWKDTMTNGLTLDANSIQLATDPELNLTKDTDYKIKADDRGFSLYLTSTGFDKLNAVTHPEAGQGQDVEFTITYKATVNKNAVQDIPEKNDIKLEYSNNPKDEKEPTPVTPQNGELKVTKSWSDGTTKDVQVVYTLSNGTKSYAVMMDGNKTSGTVDLGDGITFEITGAYAGTFKGEALKTGNWTISERVAGYDETIDGTTTQGTAAITNKKDEENPTPLDPSEPEVVNYGKKFVKADANTGERLEGAEFVVKNKDGNFLALKDLDTTKGEGQALEIAKENYTKAIETWNKAVAENNKLESDKKVGDEQLEATITIKYFDDTEKKVKSKEEKLTGKTAAETKINELKETYFAAYAKAANKYEWVDSQDAPNVVKLISDVNGKFEIKGLEKGTYKIVEVKAPEGYALPSNTEFEFTAEAGSYTTGNVVYEGTKPVENNAKGSDAMRVDNKKVSIPQTGGIGSLIFVVAGLAIMAGAYAAYRKSQARA